MEGTRSRWVWKALEDVENEENSKVDDRMNVDNPKYNEYG